jgi:hypothetical protein
MRQLVIAINVFFQRHDAFLIIQRSKERKTSFNLIQNVKTRWNSTFCMMKRALCLKVNISNWLCQQTFDSNIHTKKRQREDLRKLCMSEQEWKKVAYIIKLLRSFHDWTQRINKTRDAIVNLVFFAYNSLFDHLKDQKIKCETIDIFWSDDLTRTLRKTSNKLSKYYAMIEEKRDTLYNIEILLDSTKKLVFYQISCLTNIFHEHFSRTFLTNIFYEYFSRTFHIYV